MIFFFFFFSSRRRHTRWNCDWSSDVCSSDLIATNKNGSIKVNARLETNVTGIWALGDCKGGPAFTHISYNDFQIVYANVVEGKNLSTENRLVPYCVFTDPQLGGVGVTEKEARATGHKLEIRSEEHTSELQSQFHLVCRLLLEKKKKKKKKKKRTREIN